MTCRHQGAAVSVKNLPADRAWADYDVRRLYSLRLMLLRNRKKITGFSFGQKQICHVFVDGDLLSHAFNRGLRP